MREKVATDLTNFLMKKYDGALKEAVFDAMEINLGKKELDDLMKRGGKGDMEAKQKIVSLYMSYLPIIGGIFCMGYKEGIESTEKLTKGAN